MVVYNLIECDNETGACLRRVTGLGYTLKDAQGMAKRLNAALPHCASTRYVVFIEDAETERAL